MANLSAALNHLLRARREAAETAPQSFERYRPEYEEILSSTADLAGDEAFEELHEWMVETTRERRRLPTPDAVRARARELCAARDVTVPKDSPLRE